MGHRGLPSLDCVSVGPVATHPAASENEMTNLSLFKSISIATLGALFMLQPEPAASQRRGVIPHAPLLKMVVPNTANQEVAVYEAEYEPAGSTPSLTSRCDHLSCPVRIRRLAGGRQAARNSESR